MHRTAQCRLDKTVYHVCIVIINIVFYANSIRRSATLANFATRSSTDSCCSQQMLTSMIPTVLDAWWISVCSLFFYVRKLQKDPEATDTARENKSNKLELSMQI